jgi:hypothetical protein
MDFLAPIEKNERFSQMMTNRIKRNRPLHAVITRGSHTRFTRVESASESAQRRVPEQIDQAGIENLCIGGVGLPEQFCVRRGGA